MKSREMLDKWPMKFLVWNLNEDSGVFWTDLTTLEDNGEGVLMDPWGQRISLRGAKRKLNGGGDTIEFHITSEFQGYPVELVVLNE